jgi:hypothetical protein
MSWVTFGVDNVAISADTAPFFKEIIMEVEITINFQIDIPKIRQAND